MDKNNTSREVAIDVKDLHKIFKVYKDKPQTLKARVLFRDRQKYKENKVLNGVSFQCYRGESVGLIGHNGCGKSTTLKLLNKIMYPNSGTITMKGRISSLIELGAGFHPDMTGRENIFINASIFGLKKKDITERLDDIIRFSELEEFIDNPVRTYSSGMYMRLAFSIAINVDADILLVDEILAVGDANFQAKCFNKLRELKENGCTIVIVSHSMDQIKSFCDKVIWLDHGEIQKMGSPDDVTHEYMYSMGSEQRRRELYESGLSTDEDPMMQYPITSVTDQLNQYSWRRGNMKVRFDRFEVLDQDRKPCQSFHNGDKLILHFKLSQDFPEEMVSITFNIFNASGSFVSSFESKTTGKKLQPASSMADAYFEISSLPLAKGGYIFDCIIRNDQDEDTDLLTHFVEFYVDAPESYGSQIVAVENKWVL